MKTTQVVYVVNIILYNDDMKEIPDIELETFTCKKRADTYLEARLVQEKAEWGQCITEKDTTADCETSLVQQGNSQGAFLGGSWGLFSIIKSEIDSVSDADIKFLQENVAETSDDSSDKDENSDESEVEEVDSE